MPQYSIEHPEYLKISDGTNIHSGANQDWYAKVWKRMAGCGPTNASHLALYLSETRKGCRDFVDPGDNPANTKAGFVVMMEEMWGYVTPGYRGVNGTNIFMDGLRKYGRDRGFNLTFDVLDVDADNFKRPEEGEMSAFIVEAMQKDRPLAFLNLNNGAEKRLDRWHWVTLVAFNSDTLNAVMFDQNRSTAIDLSLWLRTTTLGGGFVAADVYPVAATDDEEYPED